MTFVCRALQDGQCIEWVQQSNVIEQLSSLSYSDVTELLGYTVAIFAHAWVWRHISKFTMK